MRIYDCWFCGAPIYPGHGMTFVRNDTKILRFCKRKCHKFYKAKKNPRKIRWTKIYRRTNGKEMIVDSTLEFVKKRNRPLKYNRDRMELAIRAIKRIHEIKNRRTKSFYQERMKNKEVNELEEARRDLTQNVHLIQSTFERAAAQLKAKQVEPGLVSNVSNSEKSSKMEY